MSCSPSDATFPVVTYNVEIVLDVIHRHTTLIDEVWLPAPYNLFVNYGSDSMVARGQVNVVKSEQPRLNSETSPRFLRLQEQLRVPQVVYVSRSWCNTIQQMYDLNCRYREQMDVLTAMAHDDSPIELIPRQRYVEPDEDAQ